MHIEFYDSMKITWIESAVSSRTKTFGRIGGSEGSGGSGGRLSEPQRQQQHPFLYIFMRYLGTYEVLRRSINAMPLDLTDI